MDTGTWWRMPPLTTRGQTAFWDAQAEGYEAADMTNDNSGELEIVLEKSREIMCDDIITLGGAVGCRDPKVILEDMLAQGKARTPKVVFNDLSEQQTRKAVEILKPVTDLGVAITFAPGEIRNVCGHIPPAPRRLILGVYHSDAFFKSEPAAGYPMAGYDEYLKNHTILGDTFFMDWVQLTSPGNLSSVGVRTYVRHADSRKRQGMIRDILNSSHRTMTDLGINVTALQIVGVHDGREGFFLSHWYTQKGILQLVRSAFPTDLFMINVAHCAKGIVLTIDPIGVTPTGIVTILNNVVGNILPHSQCEALAAVRGIMS